MGRNLKANTKMGLPTGKENNGLKGSLGMKGSL